MKYVEFNKDIWDRDKKKASILKVIIMSITLIAATIVFGIRDQWFTTQAVCCWEDYLLYLILTVGFTFASKTKNYVLNKSTCFVSSPDKPVGIQDLFEAQNATMEGIVATIKERD